MPALDHWYPVLPAQKLKKRPIGVRIWDMPIVLFRTTDGALHALNDVCPHRGTPLSAGEVEGQEIVCAYHGWRFDGQGLCAGRRAVQTAAYAAIERHGAIWIKHPHTASEIPPCEFDGHRFMHGLHRIVPAPLELLVDNFAEIEHTGKAHWLFGFPQESLGEVELEVQESPGRIVVTWSGPQKREGQAMFSAVGVRPGDWMRMVADTRFAPLNTLYSISWFDPRTGQERDFRMEERAFFARVDDRQSLLYAFYNARFSPSGARLIPHIMSLTMPMVIRYEYYLDRKVLSALDPERIELRGYRLDRMDKPVVAHRRQMAAAGLIAETGLQASAAR